jgi:hypothetical protein
LAPILSSRSTQKTLAAVLCSALAAFVLAIRQIECGVTFNRTGSNNRTGSKFHGHGNTRADNRRRRSQIVDRSMVQSAEDPGSLDEPFVEINTDRVTHENRAPFTGVLSKILEGHGGMSKPATRLETSVSPDRDQFEATVAAQQVDDISSQPF